ncbi:MAG: transglutaminase domain-containing protein [bacterium]
MFRLRPLTLLLLIASLVSLAPLQAADSDEFVPEEAWFGVYMGGSKVGYAHLTVDLGTWRGEPVIQTTNTMNIALAMLGQSTTITVDETDYADAESLAFAGLEFKQGYSSPALALGGAGLGNSNTRVYRDGTELVIESLAGNDQVTGTRRMAYDAVTMQSSYGASKKVRAAINPEKGGTTSQSIFDATTLAPVTMEFVYAPAKEIYYNGVAQQAYEVESTIKELGISSSGIETIEGLPLKTTVMGGMVELRLEDEALAKTPGVTSDLLDNSRVATTGATIPAGDVAHVELRPVIDDGTDPATIFSTSAGQRLEQPEGATAPLLIIDRVLPNEGHPDPLTDQERAGFLTGDLYVQPDNPEIQAQAKAILVGVAPKDDTERAYQIARWVHENLLKCLVPMTPNAVEVLESKRGDCGEHAVLTAALCRAAGIPAKVNYGLVYTPHYGAGYFFHAWNSVYLKDRWVEIDATLGAFPIDARYVKFGEGDDPKDALEVAKLYGRLHFEVIRAVSAPEPSRWTFPIDGPRP